MRSANGESLVYWKPNPQTPAVGDVAPYPPDRDVDEDRVAVQSALTHDVDDAAGFIFLHLEHGRNTVPAGDWDNCVEFRAPRAAANVGTVTRSALAAASRCIEAAAEALARAPPAAALKKHFVSKQRKFRIGKRGE